MTLTTEGERRLRARGEPSSAGNSVPLAPCSTTFDSTYRSMWSDLVGFASSVCGDAAVGEDLAQDAFAGLYRNWGSVDEPSAYLRRAVVNGAISRSRRRHSISGMTAGNATGVDSLVLTRVVSSGSASAPSSRNTPNN